MITNVIFIVTPASPFRINFEKKDLARDLKVLHLAAYRFLGNYQQSMLSEFRRNIPNHHNLLIVRAIGK